MSVPDPAGSSSQGTQDTGISELRKTDIPGAISDRRELMHELAVKVLKG